MTFSARKVTRRYVIMVLLIGTVFLALAVVMVLMGGGLEAIGPGSIALILYLLALFVAKVSRARSRQRRELAAGEVVRFRNKRPFFTTLSMFVGPLLLGGSFAVLINTVSAWVAVVFAVVLILGRVVYVFAVPPKGGRRSYEVTATELVIRTPGARRVIPWHEVRELFHRPAASTQQVGYTTTYAEFLELFPQQVRIQDVHRQYALTRLVIDQCRAHIVPTLLGAFDRDGEVEYGQFRLTRDGVHAPGGFLPWRADWSIRHFGRPDGVVVTVTAPDKQEVTGWVPVELIALDLLDTLAGRR
jgi:hypothetical protein